MKQNIVYMRVFLLFISLFGLGFCQPITPIPLSIKVDPQKVELGRKLFFDPILSKNNTVACANCHILEDGGDDNLKFSVGIDGKMGDINAPTVLNATFNFVQFWNGRAKDLQEQALGPIENPIEMGHRFDELIPQLQKTPYKTLFEKIYPEGLNAKTLTDAIAEYEKTLITPNAPFDRYLRGEKDAITFEQKEGYELFKSKGCVTCHHGINVGGNMYNKFGIAKYAYSKNLGRFEVTKNEEDKYFFKVPSLRNISKTAPYLHDGRFNTLEEVVRFMSHYQLGRAISDDEIQKIVSFLQSLDGDIPSI